MKTRRGPAAVLVVAAIAVTVGLVTLDSGRGPGGDRLRVRAAQQRFVSTFPFLSQARQALPLSDDERSELEANDPASTGYIGLTHSDSTTTDGDLAAKHLSMDPQWIARLAEMLAPMRHANPRNDVVWIGASGSFPALTVAAVLTCETLGLRPLVIPSLTASSYGANVPGFDYLTMERVLIEANVISHASIAASVGGEGDRGEGLDPLMVAQLRNTIIMTGIPLIDDASPEARIAHWRSEGGQQLPLAFVNIGGNQVNLGPESEARLLAPGLNTRVEGLPKAPRGLSARLLAEGIPVIHLLNLQHLSASLTAERVFGSGDSPRVKLSQRLLAAAGLLFVGFWTATRLRPPALGAIDADLLKEKKKA